MWHVFLSRGAFLPKAALLVPSTHSPCSQRRDLAHHIPTAVMEEAARRYRLATALSPLDAFRAAAAAITRVTPTLLNLTMKRPLFLLRPRVVLG